jgi:hypothetical protein
MATHFGESPANSKDGPHGICPYYTSSRKQMGTKGKVLLKKTRYFYLIAPTSNVHTLVYTAR